MDAAEAASRCAASSGLGTWKPGDPIPVMDPNKPDLATIEGVQTALAKLGYDPGAIDGEDGPRTRAAVQKFQAEHQPEAGTVDGVVGAKTRTALAAALATVLPAS